MQRVADTWRSPIGSSAIMVLIAFFDANPKLYNTDKLRQKWAKWYLSHHRFLYKKAEGNNSQVRDY